MVTTVTVSRKGFKSVRCLIAAIDRSPDGCCSVSAIDQFSIDSVKKSLLNFRFRGKYSWYFVSYNMFLWGLQNKTLCCCQSINFCCSINLACKCCGKATLWWACEIFFHACFHFSSDNFPKLEIHCRVLVRKRTLKNSRK